MIHRGSWRDARRPFTFALLSCGLSIGMAAGVARAQDAGAADRLRTAAQFVQQGRLDDAAAEAQRALSDPAAAPVAHSILGVIRLQQKRLDDSASHLRKAIELQPQLVGAHLNLAHVYMLQRNPRAALALYRRVRELDPANAVAGAAIGELERSPEGLLLLLADAVERKDRDGAAALAAGWKALHGVPVESSIRFALLLTDAGAVAESIDVLEHAKASGAMTYELAFNLGSAYVLNRDPARALEAYDAALAVRPDDLAALRQAAAVAERHGELERSLSYWLRAKKLAPENPDVLLGFGRVCLRMDLLEDAEPALEKAAGLRRDEPSFLYTLAAAKVGKRQFEAAQALLEPLVAARPKDAHLQYALGSVLYIQGKLEAAATHLGESVRLHPDQFASRYYLALVERDLGRDDAAMARLEALLQRNPDHAGSHEALGGLLMTARRYPEAEQHLRKAVELNPKSVKANYQLGLLLARLGRKEEGERQLQLATTLRDEDAANSRLQLRLLDPNP